MSETTAEDSDDSVGYIEEDLEPETALLENYDIEEGGLLIDFLEHNGYQRPSDFELGREVNETYDPDSPVLKYWSPGLKVVSDTEKILRLFGLEFDEFERFKQENYEDYDQ